MSSKTSPANNTHLTEEELNYFKQKLFDAQDESKAKIDELRTTIEEMTNNSSDNQSSQDHHQGDLAAMESQRTNYLSVIEREIQKQDQIMVALDRIETGDYGICVDTGQPIEKERLEVIPYAIRTVGAKS